MPLLYFVSRHKTDKILAAVAEQTLPKKDFSQEKLWLFNCLPLLNWGWRPVLTIQGVALVLRRASLPGLCPMNRGSQWQSGLPSQPRLLACIFA